MKDHRPLIGVSSYPRTKVASRDFFPIPSAYVDAICGAGAAVVVLPPGDGTAETLLDRLDGIVLSGGGDVSPERYAGARHETMYGISEERDAFEMELTLAALGRPELPMLCICRGMQVLNVVLGGTLHAHIPDLGEAMLRHRTPERMPARHPAEVKPDSRLANILGSSEVEVCSWHHQAIHEIGRELRPVAWAADGVIEAVEHETHPFCVGVQWHPEMQLEDAAQRRLFRAFVDRCRV
ncbi:MAG: gamma-glutamyl-gamma-aminobutyrate hydrolase family protein [Candidatus Binatia bacterium]